MLLNDYEVDFGRLYLKSQVTLLYLESCNSKVEANC